MKFEEIIGEGKDYYKEHFKKFSELSMKDMGQQDVIRAPGEGTDTNYKEQMEKLFRFLQTQNFETQKEVIQRIIREYTDSAVMMNFPAGLKQEPANNLSFIEPHEEEEAKALIQKLLGFNPRDEIRIPGFCILVKIYYPEEYLTTKNMDKPEESRIITLDNINSNKKSHLRSLENQFSKIKKSNLILPESALFFEKCRSCTALVIDIGPAAYIGERFKDWQNGIPKVGDWVVIPKNEGNRIIVSVDGKDFDMVIIYDDKIKAIVRDPSNVKIQM